MEKIAAAGASLFATPLYDISISHKINYIFASEAAGAFPSMQEDYSWILSQDENEISRHAENVTEFMNQFYVVHRTYRFVQGNRAVYFVQVNMHDSFEAYYCYGDPEKQPYLRDILQFLKNPMEVLLEALVLSQCSLSNGCWFDRYSLIDRLNCLQMSCLYTLFHTLVRGEWNQFSECIPKLCEYIKSTAKNVKKYTTGSNPIFEAHPALLVTLPLLLEHPPDEETALALLYLASHPIYSDFSGNWGHLFIRDQFHIIKTILDKHPHILAEPKMAHRYILAGLHVHQIDFAFIRDFLKTRPPQKKLKQILFRLLQLSHSAHLSSHNTRDESRLVHMLLDHDPSLAKSKFVIKLAIFNKEYSPLQLLLAKLPFQSEKEPKELFAHKDALIITLLERGEKISSFQLAVLENCPEQDRSLIRYLREHHLFPEKIDNSVSLDTASPDTILKQLESASRLLNEMQRRGFSSGERVDIDALYEMHLFKKRIKTVLNLPKFLPRFGELQKRFASFCTCYDRVVDHVPLFKMMRSFSQELRALVRQQERNEVILSDGLLKFLALWNPDRDFHVLYHNMNVNVLQAPDAFHTSLHMARRRIVRALSRFFKDPFWQRYNYQSMCIHGTKFGTLHMIAKMEPETRGIYAAGDMLRMGVAPFAGEVCPSIYSHNNTRISFTTPTRCWEDPSWTGTADGGTLMYATPTTWGQSYLFAMRSNIEFGSLEPITVFDPEQAWRMLTLKNLQQILEEAAFTSSLSHFHVTILRVRWTDSENDQKLRPLLEYLQTVPETEITRHLVHALTVPVLSQFSANEVQKTRDMSPVIFASFNHPTQKSFNREVTLPSPLLFGEGIPVCFAFTQDMERINELHGRSIEVRDFDELLLAETMIMTNGSNLRTTARIQDLDTCRFQERLDAILKVSVVPYYARPLPSHPTYTQSISFESESAPYELPEPYYGPGHLNYGSYASDLETAEIPARSIHGIMHMVRTTLWAQLAASILDPSPGQAQDRLLLALAAAYHDSARQDESVDLWDHKSAANFRNALLLLGTDELQLTENDIRKYYDALAKKDPPEGEEFTSLEQKAVHDADCLEILRCLEDESLFKPEKLVLSRHMDHEELLALVGEVGSFIRLTETLDWKNRLEYESNTPYLDILNLLRQEVDTGRYPLIAKYQTFW